MNPYGDGSNGSLNVTGTTSLPLDTKFQYTTVNVAAGGILTTNSTTGSVLYIVANQSIIIDGTIDVSNKVLPGLRSWSTVIDGVTYTTPGVAAGGDGDYFSGQTQGLGVSGYGGGGGGGVASTAKGGSGGNGSITPGIGGARLSSSRSGDSFQVFSNGNNGGNGSGGSGATYISFQRTSGNVVGLVTALSGRGGNAYGENGEDGVSGSSVAQSGTGSWTYNWIAAGGGGAGGQAGRAGVHVVLIAPQVIINGTINTSGSNGGTGGTGGRSRNYNGLTSNYGLGGGGGGGGNAGSLTISYGSVIVENGTYLLDGGDGGQGGLGNTNLSSIAETGNAGFGSSRGLSQIPPKSDFTGSPTSGNRPLEVAFTNASQGATSYSWNFGDSSGSSATNPVHTYSNPGTYTVSLTAYNDEGSDTRTRTDYITVTIATFERSAGGTLLFSGATSREYTAIRSAGGSIVFGGGARAVIIRDAEELQDKLYLYKVYDPDGNYIETWRDVITELSFTHEINSIGSTTNIELARNSDSVGTVTEPLQTEAGVDILTENDFQLLVSTTSRNQIGSGSSVDYNNRVDITAFYGSVEPLYTEDMEVLLTEGDEELLADIGAPNGRRIFTGFISEINSRYGNSETTVVQLTSYGWDLDQYPITTTALGSTTTVPFLSVDPSEIPEIALDRFVERSNSEQVTYTHRTDTSIQSTSTIISYTFKANTYKDVLDKTLELMPSNWYYRIGLGDNVVYFAERTVTPQHYFFLGKHIKALDLKGSILDVINNTLFTGGGDPALYIESKEVPASRTRRGLDISSDSRVTLSDSAEIISEGKIEAQNKILYRTTIEILSRQYDIESINVGETIGFRNFGNYVDALTMQIVGLNYNPDFVQLQLETKPPTINKRLEDLRRNMTVSENQNIPSSPS
jgi:PKD repeat protein